MSRYTGGATDKVLKYQNMFTTYTDHTWVVVNIIVDTGH